MVDNCQSDFKCIGERKKYSNQVKREKEKIDPRILYSAKLLFMGEQKGHSDKQVICAIFVTLQNLYISILYFNVVDWNSLYIIHE